MSTYTFLASSLDNGGVWITDAHSFALVAADFKEVTWLRANYLLDNAESEKRYFPSKELPQWSFAHRVDVLGPENQQILGFKTLSFGVKKAKRTAPNGVAVLFPVLAREVAVYNWSPTAITDTLIGTVSLHGVESVLTTLFQDPVTGQTYPGVYTWEKIMECVGCLYKPVSDNPPTSDPIEALLAGNFPII